MGWERVDTIRCTTCRVFTPIGEILYAANGTAHCVVCGVPAVAPDAFSDVDLRASGYRPPYGIVAAVVGVTNILFFAAAWISQL